MTSPLDCVARAAHTLCKTYKAWWHERDKKRMKRLAENIEYLLADIKETLEIAEKEWRGAYPKSPKKLRYDGALQRSHVDGVSD